MIAALSVVMMFVLSISLWMIIGGKGYWWAKALAITVSSVVAVWFGMSWHSILGWASTDKPCGEFELVYGYIQESHDNGEPYILIWVKPREHKEPGLFSLYHYQKGEPRVHRIPYTKEQHKALQQAMDTIKKGGRVVGGGKKGIGGEGTEGMPGDKDGKGGKNNPYSGSDSENPNLPYGFRLMDKPAGVRKPSEGEESQLPPSS